MVAAAVAGAAVVGGVASSAMSADASKSAAGAQANAAEDANAIQKEQYDQNTENFQPYLDAGGAGLNALLYRLGLGGSATGAPTAAVKTADQIREQLLPQFTTQATNPAPVDISKLPSDVQTGSPVWAYDGAAGKWGYQYTTHSGGDSDYSSSQWYYPTAGESTSSSVDEAGLQKAINEQLAQQSAAQSSQSSDPNYGSLLSQYAAYTPYKEYTPFTTADFQEDPGYQFRLDQGTEALNRSAAATGGLNSGRALKAAQDYVQGSANQEYSDAYNRYVNDYTTGFNSHVNNYTTGFNADQTGKNNIFNKLATVAGIGQSSAAALAGVNSNYANQVSGNTLAAGNSLAAGTVGTQNAINSGIGTATNALTSYLTSQQNGLASQSGYVAPTVVNGSGWGDASSRYERY